LAARSGTDLGREWVYTRKKIISRTTRRTRCPSNQIGPESKEDNDALLSRPAGLQAGLNAPSARRGRHERRGRSGQTRGTAIAESARLNLARGVARQTASERCLCELRLGQLALRYIDCPDCPLDGWEVRDVCNALMSQELGPRAVGRLRKVVRWSLAARVPPSFRLTGVFPQKGKTRVRMPEQDHAAPAPARDRARFHTAWTSG
jgi:hypothetical protein